MNQVMTIKKNGGGKECELHSHDAAPPRVVKVKFAYKLAVFTCAVIALSWFFEGWRQVNHALTAGSVGILVLGTVTTLLFVGVHAYWIYFEEKSKGTLRKRIALFEGISSYLEKRRSK